ncbi:MAG: M48 family metalloprotease [Hydrogenobacter thermophilus]|uniref:M48 family metalloprotease n=1 Tax=Hydrogenobacter thermophilus TaxID=940 RepID=UPI001C772A0B|nr:M48 family metalloprotease [Hydrogenobacter thermophilus]QWK19676.1 MAG: M48 family metalloprotease [Hydrogenobacter thermophilus]
MKKLFLLLLTFLVACAPAVNGGSLFNILPEEKEIEIGNAYVPYAIEEGDGLYPDRRVQEYVKSVGMTIARHTPRKLPYKFFVVNSDAVNAFALPGGPVFITRGLLLKLNSESELAGVLGHELGHINARHHAKFLEKMYAMNILFNIGAAIIADKPYAQAVLQFGQIGGQLLALKFSRDQEREADELGVIYALKAGYDPNGLLGVFETFKSMERAKAPEWLQTHPLPESRIRDVQREIQSIKPSGSLISDSEEFHTIKRLLKETEASYSEFYKGKDYYRRKDYSLALEHFKKAVELYDKNYEAHLYIAYILANSDLTSALSHAEKAYSIMPDVFSTNYVYGFVLFKAGDYAPSLEKLEKARRLIPDYADVYYYAGRDYEALKDYKKAVSYYKTALELSEGKAPWAQDAKERLRRLQGVW